MADNAKNLGKYLHPAKPKKQEVPKNGTKQKKQNEQQDVRG